MKYMIEGQYADNLGRRDIGGGRQAFIRHGADFLHGKNPCHLFHHNCQESFGTVRYDCSVSCCIIQIIKVYLAPLAIGSLQVKYAETVESSTDTLIAFI